MLGKIKKFVPIVAIAAAMVMALVPNTASAVDCPKGSKRSSADNIAQCNMENTDGNALMNTTQVIINVVIGVLGIVAVAIIVIGGVNFTLSQGDPAKTKKAKDTIMYGIIGIVVALLAYAIVNFVLSSVFTTTT